MNNKLIKTLLKKHNCNIQLISEEPKCLNFLAELGDIIDAKNQEVTNKITLLEDNYNGLLLVLNLDMKVKEIICSDDDTCLFLDDDYRILNQPIEFLLKPELAKALRASQETNDTEYSFNIPISQGLEQKIFNVLIKKKTDKNRIICLIREITQFYKNTTDNDNLTGLSNRAKYYKYLEETSKYCDETNKIFGILFFDLDRFKTINDSLGHRIGDELLIAIGNRLKSNIKVNEFVARLSGDEFTVVVKDIEFEEEVIETANRILSLFKSPFSLSNHSLEVKASIGVSVYPVHTSRIDVLTQYADTAMYTAKDLGGDQVCVFNKVQNFRVNKNFKMEQGLRKAIKKEELYLVYQPQYLTKNNQISGLEALVRWKPNDYHESISPAEFIPLAELTGYINELGLWIINKVCEQIFHWKKKNILFKKISINISRSQLIDSEIVDVVFSIMKLYGVKGNELVFEITEDSIIQNNDVALNNLILFNNAGIQIAIDDFGSGYSSFFDLKNFPFSELKIDKSIIDDIGVVKKNDAIVRAIISMGLEMDMKVVAEGVESLDQYNFLKENNCHTIQGFLLGEPELPTDIEKKLVNLTL